jgi:hypothetical protein
MKDHIFAWTWTCDFIVMLMSFQTISSINYMLQSMIITFLVRTALIAEWVAYINIYIGAYINRRTDLENDNFECLWLWLRSPLVYLDSFLA